MLLHCAEEGCCNLELDTVCPFYVETSACTPKVVRGGERKRKGAGPGEKIAQAPF